MRRTIKKSDVLREGYVKGLRKAQRIISEMVEDAMSSDADELIQAVKANDVSAVEEMLTNGVDPNKPGKMGNFALASAAASNYIGLLDTLIAVGAKVNARDKVTGKTALHYAIRNSCWKAAETLLENGADGDIEDNDGKSAWWMNDNWHVENLMMQYSKRNY